MDKKSKRLSMPEELGAQDETAEDIAPPYIVNIPDGMEGVRERSGRNLWDRQHFYFVCDRVDEVRPLSQRAHFYRKIRTSALFVSATVGRSSRPLRAKAINRHPTSRRWIYWRRRRRDVSTSPTPTARSLAIPRSI